MNIEQAQALAMICYYAKEHLKDNKTMSQSVDIAKDIIEKELKEHEQYKTIEDELGIDLVILLKGVHKPVDFIRKFGASRIWFLDEEKLQKADIINLDCNKDILHLLTNDGWHITRKVSDYGKTWALTKEELL